MDHKPWMIIIAVLLGLILLALGAIGYILAGGTLPTQDTTPGTPYDNQRLDGRMPQYIISGTANFTPTELESNSDLPMAWMTRVGIYSANGTDELMVAIAECDDASACQDSAMTQTGDTGFSQIRIGNKDVKRITTYDTYNSLIWTEGHFVFIVAYDGDVTVAVDAAKTIMAHPFSREPIRIFPLPTAKEASPSTDADFSSIDALIPTEISSIALGATLKRTQHIEAPEGLRSAVGPHYRFGRLSHFQGTGRFETLISAYTLDCDDPHACLEDYLSRSPSPKKSFLYQGSAAYQLQTPGALTYAWSSQRYLFILVQDGTTFDEATFKAIMDALKIAPQ